MANIFQLPKGYRIGTRDEDKAVSGMITRDRALFVMHRTLKFDAASLKASMLAANDTVVIGDIPAESLLENIIIINNLRNDVTLGLYLYPVSELTKVEGTEDLPTSKRTRIVNASGNALRASSNGGYARDRVAEGSGLVSQHSAVVIYDNTPIMMDTGTLDVFLTFIPFGMLGGRII